MRCRTIQVPCLCCKGSKVRELGKSVELFHNVEGTKRNGVVIAKRNPLKTLSQQDQQSNHGREDRHKGGVLDNKIRVCPKGRLPRRRKGRVLSGPRRRHPISSGEDYLIVAGDLNGHVGIE
ncbi:unnamed protein product [Haemonchus placei]|uniref:Uncharacterized protein n=1 Tax=Haemonchus placei TaxID=6290 RepID=A0A0N4VSG7_HAEPC|nr:unnamed protein product [Haemonchus placei]